MKQERLCNDVNEIENDTEVDNDDAIGCDKLNTNKKSVLFGVSDGWSPPSAPHNWNSSVSSTK